MSDTTRRTWSEEKLALEVWKYYGSIGGTDKDTMIKIVSLLLGFSTSIIGFYSTGKLDDRFATALLIVLGMLVSFVAAFIALLYGAYAAWNWAIADRIAEAYDWKEQKSDYIPVRESDTDWTAKFPVSLAKPRQKGIAPIFWIFFAISCLFFIINSVLLLHTVPCR